MASTSTSAPAKSNDGRRLFLIASVVTTLIVLPIGVTVGMSWVEMPWSTASATSEPEWISLPQVRATTNDGTVVRARVALDVPSSSLKGTIQRNAQQVGLLLEVSVASHSRAQLGTPEGIGHLSSDMRDRLNAYLGAEDAAGVRSVAIQDLLVKPQ